MSPRGVVVDLRLGGAAIDLVEWCSVVASLPVISITDQTDVLGRLHALSSGVADHIVAPFATREATARVEVMLREHHDGEFRFAGVAVDPDQHLATRNGTNIDLTPRELSVLLVLMRNRARVTSKQELLDEVWPGNSASINAVEAVVSALRRKLAGSEVIHTVHGAGYTLRLTPKTTGRAH